MEIGNFKLSRNFNNTDEIHAFSILRPYVNAKETGELILERLKSEYNAEKIGELNDPGTFYDFTRYRPTTYLENGKRKMELPNTEIYYAETNQGPDFLLLDILEPHMAGTKFVDSLLKLLNKADVKRYCLLGSMHDTVPHTKPLLVSGEVPNYLLKEKNIEINHSNYEGPSSIVFSINHRDAEARDFEIMYLLVSIPQYLQYFQIDQGFISAKIKLLEILNKIYDIPVLEIEKKNAEKQIEKIDKRINENPKLQKLVNYFEKMYQKKKNEVSLSPKMERIINQMERKWKNDDNFSND